MLEGWERDDGFELREHPVALIRSGAKAHCEHAGFTRLATPLSPQTHPFVLLDFPALQPGPEVMWVFAV